MEKDKCVQWSSLSECSNAREEAHGLPLLHSGVTTISGEINMQLPTIRSPIGPSRLASCQMDT